MNYELRIMNLPFAPTLTAPSRSFGGARSFSASVRGWGQFIILNS